MPKSSEIIIDLRKALAESNEAYQELMNKYHELLNEEENSFLHSPTYLQMKERIRFLENINGITDHNLSTAKQKMKKLEKIIQQLQEEIRKLNEEKKNPPHNARNAGRRKNDPEMIKQLSRFQNLIQEGHCKTEIMKKMGISDATYYRYKKRSADI